MIEPNIDAYGTDARPGALADHLEILAWHGRPARFASLGNMIEDNRWDRKVGQPFTTGEDEPEEPDDLVEQVRTALVERAAVLGDRYPFEITSWGLRSPSGAPPTTYHALLAITATHAHGISAPSDPRQVFEEVVADYMRQLGLLAVDFGALRRSVPNIMTALGQLRPALELSGPFGTPIYRKAAHDAGVDVVSHLWQRDHRPGRWLFLGQVTCGTSDTWSNKIGDPKVEAWRQWLGDILAPQAFLAVPHHVEVLHLGSLLQDGRAMVLDRLRLARLERQLTAQEVGLIDAVRDAEVVEFT